MNGDDKIKYELEDTKGYTEEDDIEEDVDDEDDKSESDESDDTSLNGSQSSEENINVKQTKFLKSPPDADSKFLDALLPDMRAMNVRQKIIFKRKIYQSLEEIFETPIDFRSTQQSDLAPIQNVSSAVQTIMNGIASLNELELHKLNNAMQNNQRFQNATETTSVSSASPRTLTIQYSMANSKA